MLVAQMQVQADKALRCITCVDNENECTVQKLNIVKKALNSIIALLDDAQVLSCWDPCLIAEIPSNPRSIPYHSPNSVPTILQDSNTMLPFPQTLTDPWDLQCYIITLCVWDPQMTSEIPDHISVFIILF